jgi:hypothetical protein
MRKYFTNLNLSSALFGQCERRNSVDYTQKNSN